MTTIDIWLRFRLGEIQSSFLSCLSAHSMDGKVRTPGINYSTPWLVYSEKEELITFLQGPWGQRTLFLDDPPSGSPWGGNSLGSSQNYHCTPQLQICPIIGQVLVIYSLSGWIIISPSQLLPLCICVSFVIKWPRSEPKLTKSEIHCGWSLLSLFSITIQIQLVLWSIFLPWPIVYHPLTL